MFREVSIREYKKVHPEIENPNLADVQNDEEFAHLNFFLGIFLKLYYNFQCHLNKLYAYVNQS